MEKIGEKIYERRRELRMTQKELAELLDVSDKTVSRWETGSTVPETEQILLIASALKIKVDDLFGGENAIKDIAVERKKVSENRLLAFRCLSAASYLSLVLSIVLFGIYLGSHRAGADALIISAAISLVASIALFSVGEVLFTSFYRDKFNESEYKKEDAGVCTLFVTIGVCSASICSSIIGAADAENGLWYFVTPLFLTAIDVLASLLIGRWKGTRMSLNLKLKVSLISSFTLLAIGMTLVFVGPPVLRTIGGFVLCSSSIGLSASLQWLSNRLVR